MIFINIYRNGIEVYVLLFSIVTIVIAIIGHFSNIDYLEFFALFSSAIIQCLAYKKNSNNKNKTPSQDAFPSEVRPNEAFLIEFNNTNQLIWMENVINAWEQQTQVAALFPLRVGA